MSDTWSSAPTVEQAPAAAPSADTWSSAPIAQNPATPAAAITANDDPAMSANIIKWAKKTSVPPAVIEADPQGFQKDMNVKDASDASDNNPYLAAYIAKDARNGSVIAGDYDALGKFTSALEALHPVGVRQKATGQVVNSIPELVDAMSTESGRQQLFASAAHLVDLNPVQGLYNAARGHPSVLAQDVTDAYVGAAKSIYKNFTDRPQPDNSSFFGGFADQLRNTLNAGKGLAETAFLPFAGAAGIGKFAISRPSAIIEGVPLEEVDAGVQKALLAARPVKGGIRSRMLDGEVLPPEPPTLNDRLQIARTPKEVNDVFYEVLSEKDANGVPTKDPHQIVAVEEAKVGAEHLDQAVEAAQATKTRTVSPEHLAELGREVHTETISVSPDKILDLYMKAGKNPAEGDGLFGFVKDLPAKINAARDAGTEVQIPTADYVAHVDPSVHAELSESIRMHDDALTVEEAKEVAKVPRESEIHPGVMDYLHTLQPEAFDAPQETVAHAAVKAGDQIFTGRNHVEAMDAAEKAGVDRLQLSMSAGDLTVPGAKPIDGFVTSTGRYVSREEAMTISRAADQGITNSLEPSVTGLMAEDLSPDNEAPSPAINLAAVEETIKSKPGANTKRLAQLLGPKLYGDPTNMDQIAVKEMLQNSFDALKSLIEKGIATNPAIDIKFDKKTRTITVQDNGSGMKPETLGGPFLQIAGTLKETESSSGGFGIAKMLFLFGNENLVVQTMRDGVVSTMKATGPQLFEALDDESQAPDIEVRKAEPKDISRFGGEHGTIVSVQLPESFKDPSTGEKKNIEFRQDTYWHEAIKKSPLFHDISVSWNGQPLTIGNKFPHGEFTQFANANFDWGTARIYVSKTETKIDDWDKNIHVLSNGIYQFGVQLKVDPNDSYGKNIARELYIDVSPKVQPTDAGYPFDLNRQGFTHAAKEDLNKILKYISNLYSQEDFAASVKNFGDIQYYDASGKPGAQIKLEPKLPKTETAMSLIHEGDKITVKDGKLIVNGRQIKELSTKDLESSKINLDELKMDQSKVDPNKVMLHDNIEIKVDNEWISLVTKGREKFGPRFDTYVFGVGLKYKELRDVVSDAMDYPLLRKEAIGISFDQEYRGVSIKIPFDGMFLNPAVPKYTDPVRAAVGMVGTMIHEFAHHKVRSHDVVFSDQMQDIIIALDKLEYGAEAAAIEYANPMDRVKAKLRAAEAGANSNFSLAKFKRQTIDLIKEHHDILLWLNETLLSGDRYASATDATVRNRGKRFKDAGSRQETDAGTSGDLEKPNETVRGGYETLRPSYQTIGEGEGPRDVPEEGDDIGDHDRGIPSTNGPAIGVAAATRRERRALYLDPLFKNAPSDLTQTEFGRYSKKIQNQQKIILDKAIAFASKEIKKRQSAEWKADEEKMRVAVTKVLDRDPTYTADRFWNGPNKGMLPNGKMILHSHMPEDISLVRSDEWAPVFRFSTGIEMVMALIAYEQERADLGVGQHKQHQLHIERETKKRMEVFHGKLAENIYNEAYDLAHDDAQLDLFSDELKILAKEGSLNTPYDRKEIEAVIKAQFEAQPLTESVNAKRFDKATYRNGREAEKALLAGKFDEAFKAKQQQLVSLVMGKLASKLDKQVKKLAKKVKEVTTEQVMPTMDQAHLEQTRAILQSVGITQQITPTLPLEPLAQFVADSQGQLAVATWLHEPNVPQFTDFTTQQFREFAESIKSMLHVGRWHQLLHNAQDAAKLQNVIFDFKQESARFPNIVQDTLNASLPQRARSVGRRIIGMHLLVERMFDYSDRFNPNGLLTTWIDRPLRASNTREIQLTEKTTAALRALKKHTDSTINDLVVNDVIPDAFSRDGLMKIDRGNLRQLMLHMGNASNYNKLIQGFEQDPDYGPSVTAFKIYKLVEANAKEQDWHWVQGMWDIFGVLKPEADAVYMRMTGVPVDTIEAKPFRNAFGEWAGGFAPIRYDRANSNIDGTVAAKNPLFDSHYVYAATPNRYTQARTQYKGALDLSGSFMTSYIQSMIHDIAFRESVTNAAKMINNQEFRTEIALKWGKEFSDLLPGWIKDIANSHAFDDDYAKGFVRVSAIIRQNVINTLIGYNPGTVIKHGLTAAAMSVDRVGLVPLATALKDVGVKGAGGAAKDLVIRPADLPDEAWMDAFRDAIDMGQRGKDVRKFILASSAVMRNRSRKYNDSIRGAYEEMNEAGNVKLLKDIRQGNILAGRFAVAFFDQMTALPTWYAAYKKAYLESGKHDDAVFIADKEVSRAHGSNFIGDQPLVTRIGNTATGEFARYFVSLYKFWNHMANNNFQLVWDIAALARGQAEVEGAAGGANGKGPPPNILDFAEMSDGDWYHKPEPGARASSIMKRVGIIMFVIWAEEQATAAKDESHHGFLASMGFATVRFFGSQFILLREVTTGMAYGNEPSTGLIGTIFKELANTARDIYKAGAGQNVSKNWLTHAITSIGIFFGVGSAQVGRAATGIKGLITGAERPQNQADWQQLLRTGSTKARVH